MNSCDESKQGESGLESRGDPQRVRAELVDQLYKRTPIGITATLVNSPLLVFLLWNLVPHRRLLWWLELTAAVAVFRVGLVSAYRTSGLKKLTPGKWARLLVVALGISGLLWGSAGIMLFPTQSTAHQAFVAFVLAGMVAGAVGMCSSVFSAFLAFSVPALVPILIRFLVLGDNLHTAMGVMTLLFLILTSLTAWQIHVATKELVALKEHFADKVAERTVELTRANDELKHKIEDRKQAQERLRESLKEKDVLLREIHHRVKNNLAVIISLLKMRSSRMADPSGKEALEDCYERVEAMALIHQTLYQSEDLSAIELAPYARNLAANLMQIMLTKEQRSSLTLVLHAEGLLLPIDAAVPCGLILNELFTNAFKYAFAQRNDPRIVITAQTHSGVFELSFRDNGAGFPLGLDPNKGSTLGFRIISFLVKHQMEGAWEARNEEGAFVRICWPISSKEEHHARIPE